MGLRGFAIFSSVVKGAEDHGRGGLYHPPLVFFLASTALLGLGGLFLSIYLYIIL